MAYTKAELDKKTVAELKALLDQHGIDYDDKAAKTNLKVKLLAIEDEADEVDDDELDDDEVDDTSDEADDEELDDEELDESVLDEELDEVDEPAPAAKPKAKAKTPTKAKAAKTNDDGASTLAAKQVATLLGTEAKTLRQFFRSEASTVEAVGSGGRYEFLETDLEQIKTEFEGWKAAHASRGSKRGSKAGKPAAAVEEVEEIESIDELEEPADDELDDEELELDDDEELDD